MLERVVEWGGGLDEMRRCVGVDGRGTRILLVFDAGEDARCSHDGSSNWKVMPTRDKLFKRWISCRLIDKTSIVSWLESFA
jgi:hypothetical protein